MERARSLLEAPSPAVLTTYRKDSSASVSPVWFRWSDGAFEVVVAKGDLKLRHLARDPRCALVVFEAVRPFRGVEVRGVAELIECVLRSCVPPSQAATSGPMTARDSRPSGDPSQASCFGSSPTARVSGICRASCPHDRRLRHGLGVPRFTGR